MRLFIAINFSTPFRNSLISIINQLRPQVKKARFSLPENLHLTLFFIGESEDITTITSIINSINFDQFSITLSKVGSFKRHKKEIF